MFCYYYLYFDISLAEQRISGWKAFISCTKDFPESEEGMSTQIFSVKYLRYWLNMYKLCWASTEVSLPTMHSCFYSQHKLCDFLMHHKLFMPKLLCRLCKNMGQCSIRVTLHRCSAQLSACGTVVKTNRIKWIVFIRWQRGARCCSVCLLSCPAGHSLLGGAEVQFSGTADIGFT